MKIKNFIKFAINLLIFNNLFFGNLPLQKLQAEQEIKIPDKSYIRNIPKEKFYILGPGDVMQVRFQNSFNQNLDLIVPINADGIAYLRRLENIYVEGLTLKELTKILNEEYSEFFKEPNIEITLLNYRPVKIFIKGEVENPGLVILKGNYLKPVPYINKNFSLLNPKKETTLQEQTIIPEGYDGNVLTNQKFSSIDDLGNYPNLFEAIKKSGGITNSADLSKIKVTRKNSISNGSGKIQTTINLLKAIELEDTTQNIRLLDGDTIFVPKLNNPDNSQVFKAIKSNLNPKFQNVFVTGRVINPGLIKVTKAVSLVDAIQIAGGARVLRGPVLFVRYNNNGEVDRRKFALRNGAKRGSYRNPYLKEGDLIFVGNNLFNNASEVIKGISEPFNGFVTTYGLYKALTDD